MMALSIADSFRALADWYEAHPDAPVPIGDITCNADDTPEEAARLARMLSPCDKEFSSDVFRLRRAFGGIGLAFLFWRSTVCTPRVVGTRDVPEQVVPAHVEEIVEWDCPESVLAKGPAPVPAEVPF